MPKKQNQIKSSDGHHTVGDYSPVCTCMELNLKHTSRRKSTSHNELDTIDDKYAVMHWSDAYKMDIHEGEPVLIVRHSISSSVTCANNNNDDGDIGDSFSAAVCNIRISPSAQSSSMKKATPKNSNQESPTTCCGNILLSPNSLCDNLISTNSKKQTKTNTSISQSPFTAVPSSTATSTASNNNEQYTSPSKSNFSFSKGGGGESLITPPPTKYTSPSGSKFSFSKGGGGDNQARSTPNSVPSKQIANLTKVIVMPLLGLSPQQLRRLCPDAQTIQIYPVSNTEQSSYFSSSSKIIQTLITSKYKGKHVQAQPGLGSGVGHTTTTSSEQNSPLETVSISFRGQIEYFHIANVIARSSIGIQDRTNQHNDENELSNIFDQLDIASNSDDSQPTGAMDQKHCKILRSILQQHFGQQQNEGKPSKAGIAYRITAQTKVEFVSSLDNKIRSTEPQSTQKIQQSDTTTITVNPICAGLDSTLSKVKDALLPPLLHPNLFPADGPLRPPKGALLYGPAGVGKSLMAAQIANDLGSISNQMKVHVSLVQCADILSSTAIIGEGEKLLTSIFQKAEREAAGDSKGSLIILDDVHLICPRRGGMGGSNGLGLDQLAGTLLALLDGIGSSSTHTRTNKFGGGGGVVVLAITTEPSLLDPALRRPGRLDVEIEVPVPHDEARADILRFHLSQLMTKEQMDRIDVKVLARTAKGFTGADCKLAVKEAVRTAISRTQRSGREFSSVSSGIEYADLEHAIRITKPSAIKSVAVEVPKVPWSAIGGMDEVKALLKESIELPLTHHHLFEMMQVPPPKGILLYGPPGCSKTLMARAIATEGNMNFLAVKGPELLSKWLGESERALASLFRRARLAAPSVIFFDEMDAIASKRGSGGGGGGGDRLLSQLLTELDGVTSGGSSTLKEKGGRVVVVGATNRPDVLDPALTRPGRMDRMIYVGLPDEQGRKSIFKIGLRGKDCNDDVDISELASDAVSKGYSGAEIIALCRDAALHAIGEMDDGIIDRPQVHMRHLLRSINDMKPRTTREMLQFYEGIGH